MTIRRRVFFGYGVTFPICGLCNESSPYADPVAADAWIKEWLESTKSVHGALHLFRFSDGMYAVTRNIGWSPNVSGGALRAVSVPKGFVSDLASIPRIFWSLLPKDGRYTYAALIHDFLYWSQTTSREEADGVFMECMTDFKVAWITREAIYRAVRSGGDGAWHNNRNLRVSGEKRVLKFLPTDPLVSWSSWKSDPSNY